jgi:putative oxidoreductase
MSEDFGKLVLRITLGALLLFHGMHMLLNGIAPIKAMVAAHNIPDVAAYGVYLGEIAAPLMVLLGVFARVGGALIAVNMVTAVLLAGMSQATVFNAIGGYGLELEAFYFWSAVAVMLLGAGRFAIAGGRWN